LEGSVVVLRLYAETDSHIEQNNYTDYPYPVCLFSDTETISCRYALACTESEQCLGSISYDANQEEHPGYTGTNAHPGGCGFYEQQICCNSTGGTPPPPKQYNITLNVTSPLNDSVWPTGASIKLNYTAESLNANLTESWYQLDTETPVKLGCEYYKQVPRGSDIVHICNYSTIILPPSDGTHILRINATNEKAKTNSTTVWFHVNVRDGENPSTTIYSPVQDGEYAEGSIQLNYSAEDCVERATAAYTKNRPCSMPGKIDSCWYVLEKDGSRNGIKIPLPACDNTTLNLLAGQYNLTVYANDTIGNVCLEPDHPRCAGRSGAGYWPCCDRRMFTVTRENQPPEPLPESLVNPLDPYQFNETFNISWSGTGPIKCYMIQYNYSKNDAGSGWRNITFPGDINCTTLKDWIFDSGEYIDDDNGPSGYKIEFRSRALATNGSWEKEHSKPDTSTTVYLPRLIQIWVIDMFGNILSSPQTDNYYGAMTTAGINVTINVRKKVDPLDIITINYAAHAPGDSPEDWVWQKVECPDVTKAVSADECNVTVGPYKNETMVHYNITAVKKGELDENLPPEGHFYFTMFKHPVVQFLIKELYMNIGRSEFVPIKVRNIMSKPYEAQLELPQTDPAVLVFEDGNVTWKHKLNGQEEMLIYAKVLPTSKTEIYTVGITGRLGIFTDRDEISISVIFPPNFPEFQWWAIIALIAVAGLVYWKFVK
jgi:hypothetical protein